ncbi:hypothetical protein ACGVWS_02825 [Enterobacteriaceae bacterium LUAb1]
MKTTIFGHTLPAPITDDQDSEAGAVIARSNPPSRQFVMRSNPPPPPPPPVMGAKAVSSPQKKWTIKEDPALYKQQGGEYLYYSSFTLALQNLNIQHYRDVTDIHTVTKEWQRVLKRIKPGAREVTCTKANEVLDTLKKIDAEWSDYHHAEKQVTETFRGDTAGIQNSFPWLTDFITKTGSDMFLQPMDLVIQSPTIMSTTIDPKLDYVSSKEIMWHFTLEPDHTGVSEGLYKAEGEVTFPLYNRIRITSLQYLPEGQAYQNNAERFGTKHRYVINANMLPGTGCIDSQ